MMRFEIITCINAISQNAPVYNLSGLIETYRFYWFKKGINTKLKQKSVIQYSIKLFNYGNDFNVQV